MNCIFAFCILLELKNNNVCQTAYILTSLFLHSSGIITFCTPFFLYIRFTLRSLPSTSRAYTLIFIHYLYCIHIRIHFRNVEIRAQFHTPVQAILHITLLVIPKTTLLRLASHKHYTYYYRLHTFNAQEHNAHS